MNPVNNETIISQLKWRYATKQFDANKKISDSNWATLEEALLLAPSSYGLQPWNFIVVKNPATRASLKAAAWNQSQITDASHLVVLCCKANFSKNDVQRYVDRIAQVRKVSKESLAGYQSMMEGFAASLKSETEARSWCTRQVYIALGQFLTTAAMLGIDACPMEGFSPEEFDKILGLEKLGYHAVVVATAGYRSAEDHYAELAKVRFAKEEVIRAV